MTTAQHYWTAYRLRWKRRRLLFRSFRKRRQLSPIQDNTRQIRPGAILLFSTMRNEAQRLPYFLTHYRNLGVDHFLIVDNGSDDATRDLLAGQNDVSLWGTAHSYKQARFGIDWLTWLQARHGHGHWCLSVDADELLIYPFHETRPLPALTGWLDANGQTAFGAMMLDLYPKGPLQEARHAPGQNPVEVLNWFDSGNYTIRRQAPMGNLWIQGGVRMRRFFANEPRRAPTLNKVPLVRWNRRYAYVSSTHSALPRHLNHVYDTEGGERLSGILLHTKFLPSVVERSREEKQRREHFANSSLYDHYYDSLMTSPDLWCEHSSRFIGWRQLEAMGLMSKGTWV